MTAYTSIPFQHSTLNREVKILLGQIVGYHRSEAHFGTVIYTTGGAIFPVKQSVKDVEQIINDTVKTVLNAAIQPTNKE